MSETETKKNFVVELNDFLERMVHSLIPVRGLLVFFSNVATVVISLLLAFALRFDFNFTVEDANALPALMILALLVKIIVFMVFKLYGGMWRYVSIGDLIRILIANLVASGVLISLVWLTRGDYFHGFSITVLGIDFLFCFLLMSGKRVATRIIRESAAKASGEQNVRTLLVGNLDSLNGLLRTLDAAPSKRKVIGLLTDNLKTGQSFRNQIVVGNVRSAAKCAKKHDASEILLLPPYSTPTRIREIMEDLDNRGAVCALRMVPAYTDIAEGNISVSHIKEVEIEDLLGRNPVSLDRTEVEEFIHGRSVMVTGAGGSIGTELCHQIAGYHPAKIVLFELCEYNLYEIDRAVRGGHPELAVVPIIGDVRSPSDINAAISGNGIDIVCHAAAYKHVPLMEMNPDMAFLTNVIGTANVAEACEKHGVKRMIMISSDKAVNPTSVMGSTKRIAERALLERPASGTDFVVVRFGNVLGSSGSVIPLFKQQIRDGGPVTVTSENVVRYFMSIPEAVDLVLQAGAIGDDRDIMVLEMGEPVRIYDMARKLIALSGFDPDVDIEIKVTGLRPGEKEYEELLTDEEKVDRTPYDRIFVARKGDGEMPPVDLDKIAKLASERRIDELRRLIIELIPENKLHESA